MFGRDKTTNEQLAEEALHPQREGAKNRPTPRRRDQEAARKRPLVVTDRKQAKQLDRRKRSEAYAKQKQAMLTGDERHLPARDRGPVRRFIRDHVDARWNVGEFLLPVMVLVLGLSLIRITSVMSAVVVLTWGIMIVAVLDCVLLWRRLKRRLVEKFGADEVPSGAAMYAAMRAMQMRRLRMPRPMVGRGQSPD